MSDHLIEQREPPKQAHEQSPLLLDTEQPHQEQSGPQKQEHGVGDYTRLDKTLQQLESFLSLLCFGQTSPLRFGLSWVAFLAIGVAVPVTVLVRPNCSRCDLYQIEAFELDIVVLQACLAAVSLLCLSHNLRMLRNYAQQLQTRTVKNARFNEDSIRLLVLLILPCFILKIIREVIRLSFIHRDSWWQSCAIFLALIVSWTFVSTIFLSACIMFHLVCKLQIIHFHDYGKLLEREVDVMIFIEEHTRLWHHLSKISHRFRIYLLLQFVVAIASQFVTLFQIMEYSGKITFINGSDFAVSSLAQVVGIILCLNAASKISHRAQGIASMASRWHALATCSTNDTSRMSRVNSVANLEAANHIASMFSESDLESLDYIAVPTNNQLASYMTSYQRRQAFVMYLQNNPGGITIFGWTVDRGLVNTIFFLELSLVLFVFGRTTVFASSSDPQIFSLQIVFHAAELNCILSIPSTSYTHGCHVSSYYWLLLFPVNDSVTMKSYSVTYQYLSCQRNQILSLAKYSSSSVHTRHAWVVPLGESSLCRYFCSLFPSSRLLLY